MSPANRAVIQMVNGAVIVFLFMITFISFEYSQELVTSSLGKVLLLRTSLFWMARLVGEFTLKARFAVKPALVVAFAIPDWS
ncbi:MAG: hypothetical protein H6Q67_361 [Firmicutes bacterium]|nr:hypothetical protein [Bacillota bacterium]